MVRVVGMEESEADLAVEEVVHRPHPYLDPHRTHYDLGECQGGRLRQLPQIQSQA